MKKILIVIFALAFTATVLVGCSVIPRLNDEQQKMLDIVMDNIDMWETKEDMYANYIQLQEISGTYCLCVGYSSEIAQPTNEAVSSYASSMCHAFKIDSTEIVDAGESSMIMLAEMFMWGGAGTGRELIGNTIWYYTSTYEEKYEHMENLFLKLIEDE